MDEMIRWHAYEHAHTDQASDWFWALGVVAACGAITSILFHDFFFALVILAGATTIGLIAKRPPEVMEFEISDRGVTTHGRLHKFSDIIAFWVGHTHDGAPSLFLDTSKLLSPNLIIPLGDADTSLVRKVMLEHATEREMQEPLGHRILRFFGF